jgi:hypothetical protein
LDFNVGSEINIYRLIDVRIGYMRDNSCSRDMVVFGIGLGPEKYRFNYSYIPETLDAFQHSKIRFFGLSIQL